MCLVSLAYHIHARFALLLAAKDDEFHYNPHHPSRNTTFDTLKWRSTRDFRTTGWNDDVAAELVPLGATRAGLVLLETLLRILAGLPHIEALQHTVVLWVSRTEPPILGVHLARELDDVDGERGGARQRWR
jgi:hypothetical protein